MSGSYDQRAAARKHAEVMARDLDRVSGLLEETATVWRRGRLFGQQPSMAPGILQDEARSLADAVRGLPDADSGEHPALAFSAVARLAALRSDAALSAAVTDGSHLGDARIWAAIQDVLLHAGNTLWSLISHLVEVDETTPAEDTTALREAPVAWDRTASPDLPAAACGESRRALAMQRAAIDALPEVDLRRLLGLIGGMDPAALQRAAVAYTETFCAVTEAKASVAALRPVALVEPCDCLQEPGRSA